MMDIGHGVLLGSIGCILTIIGFAIAYLVANHYHNKENEEKKPLTIVQQSLKDLWRK